MILKNFQDKAIKKLISRSKDLIRVDGSKKLIFKSPTGSGKTIMMAEFLRQLVNNKDLKKELSFIWTAPRKLHKQSKDKLQRYFKDSRDIDCVEFEQLIEKKIPKNQILFLNWESINKKNKNTIVLENEKEFYLNKIIEKTKDEGNDLILIIDESHFHATSEISRKLISDINPKLTIEVSATPVIQDPDEIVSVSLEEVKIDGLIKKSVILNQGFKNLINKNYIKSSLKSGSEKFVLDMAIKKRLELLQLYKKSKSIVNPLILIQLPDNKPKIQNKIIHEVQDYLKKKYKINTENGKLAIYLSGSQNKINLENISKSDNEVEVLIFKQAIALGWDCPRAQILSLFRDWKSLNFSIQTVGRIMRMPEIEKKHYNLEPLNHSYIFTNIENIHLQEDSAKDYVTIHTSKKTKNIHLSSYSRVRQREKTRLSPIFTQIFLDVCKNLSLEKKIKTNNQKVHTSLIADTKKLSVDSLINENIKGSEKVNITNENDLQKILDYFVITNTSPYYPEDRSVGRIKQSLYSFFYKYMKIDYEKDFEKIVNITLSEKNIKKFIEVLDITKEKYKSKTEEREQEIKKNDKWNFPESINYSGRYNEIKVKKSVMKPFYYDEKWKTEKNFIKYLDNSSSIKWWFKNGDSESNYFAIPYEENKDINLFYIDFIVGFKNKTVGLFDTKSGITIDKSKNKINGLIKYISNYKKLKLIGGLVTNTDNINFRGRWKLYFNKGKYLNSNDLSKWKDLNF